MGKHGQNEGNNEQRRAAAREAHEEGKLPSEVGATLGASQQAKKAKPGASHQERIEQKHEGKAAKGPKDTTQKPRPGNRDTDPKRTDRWG